MPNPIEIAKGVEAVADAVAPGLAQEAANLLTKAGTEILASTNTASLHLPAFDIDLFRMNSGDVAKTERQIRTMLSKAVADGNKPGAVLESLLQYNSASIPVVLANHSDTSVQTLDRIADLAIDQVRTAHQNPGMRYANFRIDTMENLLRNRLTESTTLDKIFESVPMISENRHKQRILAALAKHPNLPTETLAKIDLAK